MSAPFEPPSVSHSSPAKLIVTLATVLLVSTSVICSGCKQTPGEASDIDVITGETMGTTYTVKVRPSAVKVEPNDLADDISKELALVNQQMSTYISESEVSRFNSLTGGDWFPVSRATAEVCQLAEEISKATSGRFDITVLPLVNLWGFGPRGLPASVPSELEITEQLSSVGYAKVQVRLDPPALKKDLAKTEIDLSAIAKGHGVDRVVEVIRSRGITDYFVEIGGEVRVGGTRDGSAPWRVGIERPDQESRAVQTVIPITDLALATSGNYRNYYETGGERFAHFVDPQTGRPYRSPIVSVSVFDDTCARADGFATGLSLMTPNEAIALADRLDLAVMLIVETDQGLKVETTKIFKQRFPTIENE